MIPIFKKEDKSSYSTSQYLPNSLRVKPNVFTLTLQAWPHSLGFCWPELLSSHPSLDLSHMMLSRCSLSGTLPLQVFCMCFFSAWNVSLPMSMWAAYSSPLYPSSFLFITLAAIWCLRCSDVLFTYFIYCLSPALGGSGDEESACNARDPGSILVLGRSSGEANGNPLQSSCLENPMDRGAWWVTVHRSQRVGCDWVTNTFTLHLAHTKKFKLYMCRNFLPLLFTDFSLSPKIMPGNTVLTQ